MPDPHVSLQHLVLSGYPEEINAERCGAIVLIRGVACHMSLAYTSMPHTVWYNTASIPTVTYSQRIASIGNINWVEPQCDVW